MGNISKILGKIEMGSPNGWNPEKEQYNLPFTVELKENFHIHWQDIRIEIMPEDIENFVIAIIKAYELWKKDGKPSSLPDMKRYGWWPGEEGFRFMQDRYEKFNKNNDLCHNFRTFPRTQRGKLYFENVFQVELQVTGQYHIHYKNFRLELGKNLFKHMTSVMMKGVEIEEKYGNLYSLIGKIRVILLKLINMAKGIPSFLSHSLQSSER